jgi:energy-coupling factor transporter transmembrane protein EcfT
MVTSVFRRDIASPIHAWDARWKTATLVACMFLFAAARSALSFGVMAAVCAALTAGSRLPPHLVLRALRFPFFMALLMAPPLLVSAGGDILWRIGPMRIYAEGVRWSAVILVRSTAVMILCAVLFATTEPDALVQALRRLGVPGTAVFIGMAACRYIFLFSEYLDKLGKAARLRGLSRAGAVIHARTSLHLLSSLLVRGVDQQALTDKAMRLRGFRTVVRSHTVFKTRPADIAKSAALAGAAAAVAARELL